MVSHCVCFQVTPGLLSVVHSFDDTFRSLLPPHFPPRYTICSLISIPFSLFPERRGFLWDHISLARRRPFSISGWGDFSESNQTEPSFSEVEFVRRLFSAGWYFLLAFPCPLASLISLEKNEGVWPLRGWTVVVRPCAPAAS